jgi:putative tryptophan/tyrosine transport system substrate-binding protein
MTEISSQRSKVRNRKTGIMSEDAECAERFFSLLFATAVKPISDLRLLISGLFALLFALCSLLLAPGFPAEAQQSSKIPRIGYLRVVGEPSIPGRNVDAFLQGLKDLGYVEGKNILIEFRYAEGKRDRIPGLVAELVQLKVDVLVSPDPQAIRAAKQATKTIPIVMVINQDPIATGLVDSLARPGGNITGVSRLNRELSGKRLELLTEIIPGISRVGVLWDASAEGPNISFKEYQAAAHALRLQLQSLEVRGPSPDLYSAFQSAIKGRVSALITVGNNVLDHHRKEIAQLSIKHRLPSMYESSFWIEPGGLISYSSNDAESYRRAAWMVDKILKGTKPADIPVEQPTKFELVINLKTAKVLNLTIPQSVLFRADRVIK